MSHPRTPDTSGPLVGFFAMTFAVTWTCFLGTVALSADQPLGTPLSLGARALILIGTFAPALVAIALTARSQGDAGLRALLGRLFHWRVATRWYVFAVGYFAVIRLVGALVHRVVVGVWPTFGATPPYLMLAALLFSTVIGGQAGEEIGWRGYALPRLAARLGWGGASLVLGVIWATWHLPLFYLRGADKFGQAFLVYLLQVTALSVAIAYLYWRTGGSLLLTMLMHASVNNTKDIVPSVARTPSNPLVPSVPMLAWISMSLLWAMAAYFLFHMRRAPRLQATGLGPDPPATP